MSKDTVAPRPWRVGGLGTNILDADGDQIALVSGMPPIGNQGDTANAAHIVKAVNALENGNAAALRKALEAARAALFSYADGGDEDNAETNAALAEIDAALAAPARNCDRFATQEEAWNFYFEHIPDNGNIIDGFAVWLFATELIYGDAKTAKKEGGAE